MSLDKIEGVVIQRIGRRRTLSRNRNLEAMLMTADEKKRFTETKRQGWIEDRGGVRLHNAFWNWCKEEKRPFIKVSIFSRREKPYVVVDFLTAGWSPDNQLGLLLLHTLGYVPERYSVKITKPIGRVQSPRMTEAEARITAARAARLLSPGEGA